MLSLLPALLPTFLLTPLPYFAVDFFLLPELCLRCPFSCSPLTESELFQLRSVSLSSSSELSPLFAEGMRALLRFPLDLL